MINIRGKLDPKVRLVGNGKTPVIVIDDFSDQIDALRQIANGYAHFSKATGGYPGQRAVLPSAYGGAIYNALESLIKSVYGLPSDNYGRCFHQLFSLVTNAEEDLSLLQRLPHFDTDKSSYFAVMHYLGDGDFGGTGFFRHRSSSIERVTVENKSLLTESVRREIEKSPPAPAYVQGSCDQFDMIDSIDYQMNRLLVYPGNLLHSGLINPARDVSHSVLKGRLTANIFVDFS
ncbi:DUF6445 family protein [Gilvimarinus sp. SDUM040013]|uniref:DUF6445 family protein n=1 Tax=Gilvimarinus gilvus TaxID=3058038 RepID=A0ABU4RWU4_9GAMM|nr:DUF6445 family protein [Gilvimarinus sp. SDUM040013]MDO3388492.1 DUF6445 family protein [Gilvimarinus sp. SDUM040013]MDX6848636.1 DUF6445 family protein [Gilvimarinus sp. SDUM040013]